MKKIRVISVFAFLLSCVGLSAQTEYTTDYEIRYDVSFSLDSLNLDKKKTETLYLFVSSDYGVFMNENQANAESIKEEMARQMKTGSVNMSGHIKSTEFPKQFYKNKKDNTVTVVHEIARENVSYNEASVPLEWEITEETKEFMGYQTQKATTSFGGRDYEAWFTFEIPISDGPYIFYGLPGLIVELYDTRRHYNFELLSVQKLEEPRVWKVPNAVSMTKEKYLDIIAKQSKDHSIEGLLSSSGVSIPSRASTPGAVVTSSVVIKDESGRTISDADFKRMRRKSIESKNNLIELK